MNEKDFGDIPRIPKGLDKSDPLRTNSAKRSGRIPEERHKVKELLKNLFTKKFKNEK